MCLILCALKMGSAQLFKNNGKIADCREQKNKLFWGKGSEGDYLSFSVFKNSLLSTRIILSSYAATRQN